VLGLVTVNTNCVLVTEVIGTAVPLDTPLMLFVAGPLPPLSRPTMTAGAVPFGVEHKPVRRVQDNGSRSHIAGKQFCINWPVSWSTPLRPNPPESTAARRWGELCRADSDRRAGICRLVPSVKSEAVT